MSQQRTLADIHGYWFEGIDDATLIVKKRAPFVKWFRSTRRLDDEMRQCFAHLLTEPPIPHPETEDDRTVLCRILLCDQLPRNMFRRTPRAYAYDTAARELSRAVVEQKRDEGYMLIERSFLYMPLTHSEEPADQVLSVRLTEELAAAAIRLGSPNTAYYESNVTHARSYQDLIARFGRFPHRNHILARPSTPEEEEYLCQK